VKVKYFTDWCLWNMFDKSCYGFCKALVERKLLSKDRLGELLKYSAVKGYIQFCKLLIQGGADVNCRDNWNSNASVLMLACEDSRSNLSTIQYLVESGADLSIVDDNQWNALWYSLFDISAKGTLVFTYLLESGINVSQINSDSYSHLHTCASIIYLDKYLQLLDFGIDSSVRNEDGETAIDILLINLFKWIRG